VVKIQEQLEVFQKVEVELVETFGAEGAKGLTDVVEAFDSECVVLQLQEAKALSEGAEDLHPKAHVLSVELVPFGEVLELAQYVSRLLVSLH
jgi:hypothetical protein